MLYIYTHNYVATYISTCTQQMAILYASHAKYAIKVKCCNLFGTATIVAVCTSLVYGCDQTFLQ